MYCHPQPWFLGHTHVACVQVFWGCHRDYSPRWHLCGISGVICDVMHGIVCFVTYSENACALVCRIMCTTAAISRRTTVVWLLGIVCPVGADCSLSHVTWRQFEVFHGQPGLGVPFDFHSRRSLSPLSASGHDWSDKNSCVTGAIFCLWTPTFFFKSGRFAKVKMFSRVSGFCIQHVMSRLWLASVAEKQQPQVPWHVLVRKKGLPICLIVSTNHITSL